MRIQYAIPCRYAEAVANLNTIVGGGIDTTVVRELPAVVGVMVALKVAGAADEFVGEQLEISSHVESPEGDTVGDVLNTTTDPLEAPAGAKEDWPLGFVGSLAMRWPAETEGTYMIHIRVNQEYEALPMHVRLAAD